MENCWRFHKLFLILDGAMILAFTQFGIDLTDLREYAKRYWRYCSELAEKTVTR